MEKTKSGELKWRYYPMCCTSAYCGEIEPACRECRNREAKDDFAEWKKKTKAIQPDKIHQPYFWEATEE